MYLVFLVILVVFVDSIFSLSSVASAIFTNSVVLVVYFIPIISDIHVFFFSLFLFFL